MQCVQGKKVVCWDRRREIVYDEKAVEQKFGVPPESMPDWLALVGDAADGYPGVKGWGAKSASVVLARFKHLESIPHDHEKWNINVSRAQSLSENLASQRDDAFLFRRLATLREDVPLKATLANLEWRGATKQFTSFCAKLGIEELPKRIQSWTE
jgi:5'-3' exonuclease